MYQIRKAKIQDIPRIRELLQNAGLSQSGVDHHLHTFFIVEEERELSDRGKLAGSAGMEIYQENALLRSFVLQQGAWNGVGLQLFAYLFSWAEQQGVKRLYLLAGVSPTFFQLLGFRPVTWSEVPACIKNSEHLQQIDSKERERLHMLQLN